MNIMGFKLGKVHIIIGVVIVGALVAISSYNKQKQLEEIAERNRRVEEERKQLEEDSGSADSTESLSLAELQQQEFIEEWGIPPEGFRWNNQGKLVAVSSEDLTNEEVLWSFLRSLSMLDFSTVAKYSYQSMVSDTYDSYFAESAVGTASYYTQFSRKAFKLALTSLEIEDVGNMAIFADGTSVATVKLKVLDLTNKDFWLEDKGVIFNKLRSYYESEGDSVKAEQYVYDYIYDAYENGVVGKRTISVEIKLDKVNLGGWLISDDTDLDMALRYDKGVDVADYILKCYEEWYKEVIKQEREAGE